MTLGRQQGSALFRQLVAATVMYSDETLASGRD